MVSNRKHKKRPSLNKQLRESRRREARISSFTLVGNMCDVKVDLPAGQSVEFAGFCYCMEHNPLRPTGRVKIEFKCQDLGRFPGI